MNKFIKAVILSSVIALTGCAGTMEQLAKRYDERTANTSKPKVEGTWVHSCYLKTNEIYLDASDCITVINDAERTVTVSKYPTDHNRDAFSENGVSNVVIHDLGGNRYRAVLNYEDGSATTFNNLTTSKTSSAVSYCDEITQVEDVNPRKGFRFNLSLCHYR